LLSLAAVCYHPVQQNFQSLKVTDNTKQIKFFNTEPGYILWLQ